MCFRLIKNSPFTYFKTDISKIELPKKFTFPFYYEPHILSKIASSELQEQLLISTNWQHNFGLNTEESTNAIGKMFGVLVVKNKQNEIGYLSAFSGKLIGKNNSVNFVPPVFDIYSNNGFFQKEEKRISQLSTKIQALENDTFFHDKINTLKILEKEKLTDLAIERKKLKNRKFDRKLRRLNSHNDDKLVQESLQDKFYLKELIVYWDSKLETLKTEVETYKNTLIQLKNERKERSEKLHKQIFDNFQFLNKEKKSKPLLKLFKEINKTPIAGTGDCAAPRLLQYAFDNDLQPVSLAEFWWGKPLKNEIRKHKNYYPACNGKCRPILNYMLNGMELDQNPMLINQAKDKKIEFLFEDKHFAIINKPTELLSIPGINIKDSVLTRMKEKYPHIDSPFIVHRLDMSTSGIMIIAKTKRAHKRLQNQFVNRTIKKEYTAVLNGIISTKKGTIDLPLITDFNDTPKQKICFKTGKNAITNYEVVEQKDNKTRIKFYPVTGRTHQLRIHSAHYLGLNTSILGDDLYGKKNNRLHLHASAITFIHPITKEKILVECNVPF